MIKTISKPQLRALLESVFNVLRGTIDVTISYKRFLKRYKTVIRKEVAERKKKAIDTLLVRLQDAFKGSLESNIKTCPDQSS